MKKIISLLLAMVLLVPALALAEPVELPTFDFTAEEWLVRYQEVVGEDSEWWFDEFESGRESNPDDIPLHYRTIHTIEGVGEIQLRHQFTSDQVYYVAVFMRTTTSDERGMFVKSLFDEAVGVLREIASDEIRVTLPDFTDDDITEVFEQLGMMNPTDDVLYHKYSLEKDSVFFTYGFGDAPWFIISSLPES